jgi:hypothetical protein
MTPWNEKTSSKARRKSHDPPGTKTELQQQRLAPILF